ncbi:hypothetical protein KRX51_06800 [Corynebacterium sp. TAE3-ERU12]|uniref:hypothetical protein n=1 Tax=Corynebacterium sp. TAE3-ERU12 TaxID=2849491 RepID=UPI001C4622B1|nr:hypothetical protein [Corynebacterium sp. TAE3-ERU12]MBV7295625.1 hypothetical protein [Corynebacterium sp. TAE3-ERU12]
MTIAAAPLMLPLHIGMRGDDLTMVLTPLSQRVQAQVSDGSGVRVHGFYTDPSDVELLADVVADLGHAHVEVTIPVPMWAGLGAREAAIAAIIKAVGAHLRTSTEGLAEKYHAGPALNGRTQLVHGSVTGEIAEAAVVLSRGPLHWAISLGNESVPLADVVATTRRLRQRHHVPTAGCPDALLQALAVGDAEAAAAAMHNDLAPGVITHIPRLRRVLSLGEGAGIVCGAGSAAAFALPSRERALDAAAQLATTGAGAWTLAAAHAKGHDGEPDQS